MILGIDASNLRGGGGLTHVSELLRAATPSAHGFSRVIVWAGRRTLDALPELAWLERVHEPMLDGPLPVRVTWQRAVLPARARGVGILLAPGGVAPDSVRPHVVMSQNMLPFERKERERYGASWSLARLLALRAVHGRAFARADGVIFLSEFARDRICASLGAAAPRRTAIIPHGVDARFRNAPRAQRALSACTASEPLRIVYVSVVSPYKHQWVVADAVASLRARGLPVTLEFIGGVENAPSKARLDARLRAHDPGGEFLRFSGAVPFQQVDACYRRADLFVFASSCENMPNILLEAMAAGLPIACSERGPMPEVLGDAGVYFDPEDAGDVAGAIERMVRDEGLRQRCAQRAFDRAQKYSWSRCADETFAFLAEVARQHRDGTERACAESQAY